MGGSTFSFYAEWPDMSSDIQVTVFSNGMADVRRTERLDGDDVRRITIPVKTSDVADVLASLCVYGDVALSAPATFRSEDKAAKVIDLPTENALVSAVRLFSGAAVAIRCGDRAASGTLIGVQDLQAQAGDGSFARTYLVVATGEGLVQLPLEQVSSLRFSEPAIQAEFAELLQRKRQAIKPDSTFIELAVRGRSKEAQAVIQYALPAAAWKLSYRVLLDEAGVRLLGFAIIDNHTEEDWQDVTMAFVVGEPLTFSSDLAEIRIPQRQRVNVVSDKAASAYELEKHLAQRTNTASRAHYSRLSARVLSDSGEGVAMSAMRMKAPVADMETADIGQVGDFCRFQAQSPVSVSAGQSAVVPVFDVALSGADTALHYAFDRHPARPFRTVRFVNTTGFPLGRGVATLYETGVYGGNCIMPATAEGQDATLPHALESGVRVQREEHRPSTERVLLRFEGGSVEQRFFRRQRTSYRLQNLKPEAFRLIVDHPWALGRQDIQCRITIIGDGAEQPPTSEAPLEHGRRVHCELPAASILELRIDETLSEVRTVALIEQGRAAPAINRSWFEHAADQWSDTLEQHEPWQACLERYRAWCAQDEAVAQAQAEQERLSERQQRIRANIKAAGKGDQAQAWKADLADVEQRIVSIEEEAVPALKQEQRRLESELIEALGQLRFEWQA